MRTSRCGIPRSFIVPDARIRSYGSSKEQITGAVAVNPAEFERRVVGWFDTHALVNQ